MKREENKKSVYFKHKEMYSFERDGIHIKHMLTVRQTVEITFKFVRFKTNWKRKN